ncbi:MAG: pyridoxal-phosphate dependent enzyme, partial [Candidatus Bathyarchaeia archaeon]
NPTLSHKDRESLAIIEDMLNKGYSEVAIASTGNAAISLAALAKVAGLKVHVFYSKGMSLERKAIIESINPILHQVEGTYDSAVNASEFYAKANGIYLANPGNPIKRKGDSIIGKEISSFLGNIDYDECNIYVPTNNGTLLAGIWEGVLYKNKIKMIAAINENTNIAESIAGFHKLEGESLFKAVDVSKGKIIPVNDSEISEALHLLALEGIFCEPASAASLAALKKSNTKPDIAILAITGSAFKFVQKGLRPLFDRFAP